MPTELATLLLVPALATAPAPLPAAPVAPIRCEGTLLAGLLTEAATTGRLPGLGDPGGDDWGNRRWLDEQMSPRAGDPAAPRQIDRQLRGR